MKLVDTEIIINVSRLGLKSSHILQFKAYGFPHFIGLHKYTSIHILDQYAQKRIKAKNIVKEINKHALTYERLENTRLWDDSNFGYLLKERIDSFDYNKIINLMKQDIIIYFDQSKLGTDFNADLVIYEIQTNKHYHISFFENKHSNIFYGSSYFIDEGDRYVVNQTKAKIDKILIRKKACQTIIEEKIFSETAQ